MILIGLKASLDTVLILSAHHITFKVVNDARIIWSGNNPEGFAALLIVAQTYISPLSANLCEA